jgi:tetratricopeptide (TPR) repeat protein
LTLLPTITRLLWRLREDLAPEPAVSTDVLLPLPPTVTRGPGSVVLLVLRVFAGGRMSDRSRGEFAEALRIHPEGLLSHLYAMSLMHSGRLAEAEQAFLTAATRPAIVPVRRNALFYAALCAWKLGEQRGTAGKGPRQRALEYTRELVALGRVPRFQAFYLTVIARDTNEVDLARTILVDWERQAARDDVGPLLQRAQVELLGGAYGRARAVANRILAIAPGNEQATRYRALAVERMRQEADALRKQGGQ